MSTYISESLRNQIVSIDLSRCCYCLTTEANSGIPMTYDHIRPVSKNGENGIPSARIYVDSNGNTTYLTAKNTARIMKERNWQSVMVISQYFHIPRSKLALNKFGVSQVYSAHANFYELRDIYSTAREVVGYASYLFRQR